MKLTSKDSDFTHGHIIYSCITVLVCIFISLFILKPLWLNLGLHVPNEPNQKVDFTQPVDSIFYIRNAEWGYRWSPDIPTSIWFHPLVAWLICLFPKEITGNYRFWAISLISAFLSLILVYKYTRYISPIALKPILLLIVPLLPGGLGMATSNAELPCLVFTTLLSLSILQNASPYYSILWGSLAILTKPNALYMIPAIFIYLLFAVYSKNFNMTKNSLFGLSSILLTWFIWICIVDINSGQISAYWIARKAGSVPLTDGYFSFLKRAADVIVNDSRIGEKYKFITALIIPIIDVILLLLIPLKGEIHRLSILMSVISLVFITFATNNPNKVIVYITTFPGHISIGLLFLDKCFRGSSLKNPIQNTVHYLGGVSYIIFCIMMVLFFVIGTPFEWYY